MDHVLPWLRAVLKHWKREVLGGALIALLGVIADVSGKTIPPHVYEICGGALVFYAMYLAWREQYDELQKLKQSQVDDHTLAHAIRENTATIKAAQTRERLRETLQQATAANKAHVREQARSNAGTLAAFVKRGKELYEIKFTDPQYLTAWSLNVDDWLKEIRENLTEVESAILDAPIPNDEEKRGHPKSLNRLHGDTRGRILVWTKRLNEIVNRRYEEGK